MAIAIAAYPLRWIIAGACRVELKRARAGKASGLLGRCPSAVRAREGWRWGEAASCDGCRPDRRLAVDDVAIEHARARCDVAQIGRRHAGDLAHFDDRPAERGDLELAPATHVGERRGDRAL